MNIDARFIHQNVAKNQLPVRWTYPEAGHFDGAQMLRPSRALRMIDEGEDRLDDWYQGGDCYTHLALVEVSGHSGESGGIGYQAVTEGDVEAMHVIPVGRVAMMLEEIAAEIDDGMIFDGPFADIQAMLEEYDEQVIEMLVERAETVEVEWVDTV